MHLVNDINPVHVPIGPDWDAIGSVAAQIEVPGEGEKENVDHEKALRLDKLEELFQGDLLSLVLPEGTEISRRSVSLRGIPSKIQKSEFSKSEDANNKMAELDMPWLKELESAVVKQFLVNEYCFLSFDSFREKCSRKAEPNNQPLLYEQEYILCGKPSDRENLADTIEKLLTVRGSMNLLSLLRSPGMCAEADALSIAVSGGIAPVKFIISFFILTMWAFGEAVLDVKQLMNGGHVSFWKSDDQWELSLEELLAFRFLEPVSKVDEEARGEGSDYKDHLRVLFFLLNRELRNFRMMDVIQWNVRTIQKDFAVEDCICGVEVEAEIREQHMFLMKNSYKRTVKAVGTYE